MDFVEGIGRGFLENKARQTPYQLENMVKKQFTGGGEKASKMAKDAESVAGPVSGGQSRSQNSEIAGLRKQLARYRMADESPHGRPEREQVYAHDQTYSEPDDLEPTRTRRSNEKQSKRIREDSGVPQKRASLEDIDESRGKKTGEISKPSLKSKKSRIELLDARVEKGKISTKSRRKLKEESAKKENPSTTPKPTALQEEGKVRGRKSVNKPPSNHREALREHIEREDEALGVGGLTRAPSVAPSDSISNISRTERKYAKDVSRTEKIYAKEIDAPKYEYIEASPRDRRRLHKEAEPLIVTARPRGERVDIINLKDRAGRDFKRKHILAADLARQNSRHHILAANVAQQSSRNHILAADLAEPKTRSRRRISSSSSSSTETIRKPASIFSKTSSRHSTSPSSVASSYMDDFSSVASSSTVKHHQHKSNHRPRHVPHEYNRRARSDISTTSSSEHGGSAALFNQRRRYEQLSASGAKPRVPPVEEREECSPRGFYPGRHDRPRPTRKEIIEVYEDDSDDYPSVTRVHHAPESPHARAMPSLHAQKVSAQSDRTIYQVS